MTSVKLSCVYDLTINDSQRETPQSICYQTETCHLNLPFPQFGGKTLTMKKILSIQSSVTLGSVGNSVAAPVLTAMGHRPLAVDTISLAAHPGYGARLGSVPTKGDFAKILQALSLFDALGEVDYVISGYLGNAHQATPIKKTLTSWRRQVSDGIYILDPVLGDADNLYVEPEIADTLQSELLPLADIITPNRFELGFLANCNITNLNSAIDAGYKLLSLHPKLGAVVATGIFREASISKDIGDLLIAKHGAPLWMPASDDEPISTKNIPGGGDLLTAIITGNLASGMDLVEAAGNASQMAQRIIANSQGTRDLALIEQLHLFDHKRSVR